MNNNASDTEAQGERLPSEVLGLPPERTPEEGPSPPPKSPSTLEQLLMIADTCEYWHDPSGGRNVSVPYPGHRQHYRIESAPFGRWLRHQFYVITKKGVPDETMKRALSTLAARAEFEGNRHLSFLRVGADENGDIWLDLCDETWSAVRVSILGWERVKNPPVRFLRCPGMEALPVPTAGSIEDLWRFINCAEEDRILVVGFLMNTLHRTGPYYGLNLFGTKGSAKSTATRLLRSLVDPNEAFSQSMPTSAEHLAVSAQGQRVMAFENVSKLSEMESDWLCRLSTGDAVRRRTLYQDSDETIFRMKRPWILNGIPNVVSRGDLIDRALSVELLPIDRSNRREEGVILDEFQKVAPGILGALLEGVLYALKSIEETREKFSKDFPRMADVALWITAAEPALGFKPGTFLARQAEMTSGASAESAEGNAVAETIIGLADDGWEGFMKDLLEKIRKDNEGDRFLPQTPRALGNVINRLKSDLFEAHRVRVEKLPRQSAGIRVKIWKDVHHVHDLHTTKPNGNARGEGAGDGKVEVQNQVHQGIPYGVEADELGVCDERSGLYHLDRTRT